LQDGKTDNTLSVGATVSRLAAAALLLGAAGACVLAAVLWMLEVDGGFKLVDAGRVVATLPAWLVPGCVGGVVVGLVVLVGMCIVRSPLREAVVAAGCWCREHVLATAALLVVAIVGAVDVYELLYDPYHHWWGNRGEGGLRLHMLREDARFALWTLASVLAGSALFVGVCTRRIARWARHAGRWLRGRSKRWIFLAALPPLLLGAAMNKVALDGMPHFADSLTYLMQGRILQTGRLAMDRPAHPDLFTHTLFFVEDWIDPATGNEAPAPHYYGKYPVGWPAIVGVFDRVGAGFLANAALIAVATVLTGLIALQVTTRRVAALAALLFGLSPWAIFNGAHFASHVASTVMLAGFAWLFLRVVRVTDPVGESPSTNPLPTREGAMTALGAGLFIGMSVLVRPQDALPFALPCIVATVVFMISRWRQWLLIGPTIAVGGLVGVGVYLWTTGQVTGDPFVSPYHFEGRWQTDWNATVASCLARLAFQWVELNQAFAGYGFGGLLLAVVGGAIAARRRRRAGLWLLIVSSLSFFVFASPFGFTTVWWGPRWLLPVTPALAILAAELVELMIFHAGRAKPQAAWGVCLLVGGVLVGLLGRYPAMAAHGRAAPRRVRGGVRGNGGDGPGQRSGGDAHRRPPGSAGRAGGDGDDVCAV